MTTKQEPVPDNEDEYPEITQLEKELEEMNPFQKFFECLSIFFSNIKFLFITKLEELDLSKKHH